MGLVIEASVALGETVDDRRGVGRLTHPSGNVHRRLNAVEQIAASALHEGRQDGTPATAGRHLRAAVARWDVEAHRALLGDRSTAVLHVLSHLQAESVRTLETFLEDSVNEGVIDAVSAHRLKPVVHSSASSWELLRDLAADLSFGNRLVPLTLIDAGRDLQRGLIASSTSPQPSDYSDILRATSGHLDSSVTIAATVCDLIGSAELRAPARAIMRIRREDPTFDSDSLHSPVDPVALLRGETVLLDDRTRERLRVPAESVLFDAHESVQRAAGLDSIYRQLAPIEIRRNSIETTSRTVRIGGSRFQDRNAAHPRR